VKRGLILPHIDAPSSTQFFHHLKVGYDLGLSIFIIEVSIVDGNLRNWLGRLYLLVSYLLQLLIFC